MSKKTEALVEIEKIYATESRRVLATLLRIFGNFDVAEDALHDAFRAATEGWPETGIPNNPVSWLISTGRFKAIDAIRRNSRIEPILGIEIESEESWDSAEYAVGDEILRLVFTCCHPSITPDAQVALTLREVCDLTTEEIAHAFLSPTPTIAQRIVRAKAKIRDAKIPFELPATDELPFRLVPVLRVIYLVFNEGYAASIGANIQRRDLVSEAIRLGRLMVSLLPEPEVIGLLALMLLIDSRRAARCTEEGDIIPFDEQDRALWNREQIDEGCALVEQALRTRRFGSYTLQAAISATHANAATYEETDWNEVVGLYEALLTIEDSPVIELNLAIAIAMRDGPARGLARIDRLVERGELADYHFLHAARADFLQRLGDLAGAELAYRKALESARLDPERRFLQKLIEKLHAEVSSI